MRRSLLVALFLLGWAPSVAIPPQVAAQQRITEPIGVYIDRGILAYDDKKYAEALQNFLEAYRIDPDNAEARYFVGIAYLALDQVGEAIGHLEKARQLDPADLDIAFNLGVAYFTKGDYARSLAFAGGKHFLRFGYQFDVDDTIGGDYFYVGQKASAGFQVTGPWDIRFQAGYDFQFRDYPNKNRLASTLNYQREEDLDARGALSVQGAPFRVMRRDSDHTFTTSLSRDFVYGQQLLNVALEFFKERNSSTFSLFDFDRNVVTLSIGWKY